MANRRTQVLDGALAVLGADGPRGLTYQAVDLNADVPAGTTSNCFRTREALLHGVLAHLAELDRADWARFAGWSPASVAEFADALVGLAWESIGPGRLRTRARYMLFLESATRSDLAEVLAQGRIAVLDWGARCVAELGLPTPRERYRRLAAQLDGVVLHQLTFPDEPFDPLPGFLTILNG